MPLPTSLNLKSQSVDKMCSSPSSTLPAGSSDPPAPVSSPVNGNEAGALLDWVDLMEKLENLQDHYLHINSPSINHRHSDEHGTFALLAWFYETDVVRKL